MITVCYKHEKIIYPTWNYIKKSIFDDWWMRWEWKFLIIEIYLSRTKMKNVETQKKKESLKLTVDNNVSC